MAFYVLLKWIEEGKIKIISSDALIYENERMSDPERKLRIRTYLSLAKCHIELSDRIIERAKGIINVGFKALDALHLAMAEAGNADYFITYDSDIMSILEFFTEVLYVKNIKGN